MTRQLALHTTRRQSQTCVADTLTVCPKSATKAARSSGHASEALPEQFAADSEAATRGVLVTDGRRAEPGRGGACESISCRPDRDALCGGV